MKDKNYIQDISQKSMFNFILDIPNIKNLMLWSMLSHLITICIPFTLIFIMSKIWFVHDINTFIQIGFFFTGICLLLISSSIIKEELLYKITTSYCSQVDCATTELLIKLPFNHLGFLPLESQYSRYLPLRNYSSLVINSIVKPILDAPLIFISFSIITFLLGFVYFIFVALVLALLVFTNSYLNKTKDNVSEHSEAVINGLIRDIFNNIEFIKNNNLTDFFRKKLLKTLIKRTRSETKLNNKFSLRDNITETILMVMYLGTLIFSVYYAMTGSLNIQFLIIIIILIWFCISPFKSLTDSLNQLPKILELKKQFTLLRNLTTRINRHKKIDLFENFHGSILLKSVSLNFSGHTNFSLNNINLNVERGELLLLNGMSGSGKSTLLNIISGLYLPSAGTVAIDLDRNIVNEESLSDKIIHINQNSMLNNETIIENIKLTSSEVLQDEINEMLEHLNISDTCINRIASNYSLSEIKALLNNDDAYKCIQERLILTKLKHNTKDKIILIDEPFIDEHNNNFTLLYNILNEIKPYNTIIIASRYNYYSKLANKIIILNDGKIIKHFKKSDSHEE